MTDGLEIITSTLFFSQMCIKRSVSGSSRQVLSISEWYMLTIGAPVELGESKVNYVDEIFCLLITTNEEVIRFDVSMENTLCVDTLYQSDHLNGNHTSCAQVELVLAMLEEAFQALSEQVHHHNMKLITTRLLVCSNVVKLWNVG